MVSMDKRDQKDGIKHFVQDFLLKFHNFSTFYSGVFFSTIFVVVVVVVVVVVFKRGFYCTCVKHINV